MQFRYYIPGLDMNKQPTHNQLAAAGLGHVFLEHETINYTGCVSGPDGRDGVTVGVDDKERVGYLPKTDQQAKQEPGKDWWILYHPDDLPTPEQLRKRNLAGYDVRLANNTIWSVAKARHFFKDEKGQIGTVGTLPSVWKRDAEGLWTGGDIQDEFAELWYLANEYHEMSIEAERDPETDQAAVSFHKSNELAMAALGMNYRVSAAEIELLRAYDDDSRWRIIEAVLDTRGFAQLLEDMEKKTTDISSDSVGGDSPNGQSESTTAATTEPTHQA